MNVNISNEFNFSVVHGAMNRSGSLAKLTTPTGIFLTNRFSSNPGHLSKAARASQFIYT